MPEPLFTFDHYSDFINVASEYFIFFFNFFFSFILFYLFIYNIILEQCSGDETALLNGLTNALSSIPRDNSLLVVYLLRFLLVGIIFN